MNINFKPNSLLAFLTAAGFLGWIGGTYFKTQDVMIGAEIASKSFYVFSICFVIWLVYIGLSLFRSFESL